MRIRSAAKRSVRRFARSRGYDLVPLRQGIANIQAGAFSRTDLVLDVGANVGQYADRIRALGYKGPIISFEPQKKAYSTLKVSARRDSQWDVRQVAIGELPSESDLYVSDNSVSSSLLKVTAEHTSATPHARTVRKEKVAVSTLDHELPDLALSNVWLKLDIQGHELPALRGGPDTLRRCLGVQLEVSFTQLYVGQAPWLDLCAHLQESGFVLRYFEPGFEDPYTGALQQADAVFLRP